MRCGSCGAENPGGARFCNACGHPLAGRADERRIATVLFADVVGFTGLSEVADPEQVKNLVDDCFERLARDVTAFGGQVDKVVGDALVALFGAPVAHEDDAERAVRAALRMQETVAGYNAESGAHLRVRIGVNTGEVLVGSFRAGGEYTAMGDAVNVAQRLEAWADPGSVVVGPDTWSSTREVIAYDAAGAVSVKGRAEPVSAHVARRALQPPGHRRRRSTPFVGRRAELGLLRQSVGSAVSRRRAQLVLVLGEAGVGKTRIAGEVAADAQRRYGAAVFEGRCLPYGEANVWWPVAEALRAACGIPADAPLAEAEPLARRVVATTLGRSMIDPETDRVVQGLLHLLGFEVALRSIDPARALEEAGRAVLVFLEAAASAQPLVIVVSDLHWAADVVLDLLDTVLTRIPRRALVIIVTARPELLDRWTPRSGEHDTLAVTLDPLDRDDAAELLDALDGHRLAPDLRDRLLDRSGGNPFFLEELVALVAETDAEGDEPGLPDTLRGLVAARLDALDPALRAVLQDAAVWGRSGPIEALARMALVIHGVDEVRPLLEALGQRELLTVDGNRWSFTSEVVREVAYATLTKADRARRHAGIAAYLEAVHPDPESAEDRAVDVIAHHFAAAAQLTGELGGVPDISDAVVDVALEWLEEAARRAELSQALPVSAQLWGRAIELVDDDPGRQVRYLLGRAASLTDQRRFDDARADLERARRLAAAGGRPLAAVEGARGEWELKRGDTDRAVATLEAAARRFEELGDQQGLADVERLLGMAHIFKGEFGRAERSIGDALARMRALGDRRGEAWALQNLAWISFLEGRNAEAEDRLHVSAATFTELGDIGGLNWARGLLAFVRFQGGRLAEAESLAEQILVEARARGDRWGEGMMLLLGAGVQLWSGRPAEAVRIGREAVATFTDIGDRFGSAQASAQLGRALVMTGAIDDGLRVLHESLDRVRREAGTIADDDLVLAVALAATGAQLGDPDLALGAVAQVGPGHPGEDWHLGHTDLGIARGLALVQAGRVEEALDQVLRCAEVRDGAPPPPSADAAVALVCAAAGDDDEALRRAAAVLTIGRATYADRWQARAAELLVAARRGEPTVRGFADLVEDLEEVGDPLSLAAVRVMAARAAAALDDPGAEAAAAEAQATLDQLGIAAAGWRAVADRALAGVSSAEGTGRSTPDG